MSDLNTYKNTQYSKSLDNYFYTGQIRKLQIQFAAIFSELQVAIGNNDFDQQTNLITVPVKMGPMDRVVAAILSGNTQNKPIRAPAIATNLIGIEPAWDFVKGLNQKARNVVMPVGGVFPDDIKVVRKLMPFPYFMIMEASILASNEYQHQQMLEQILLLFNPDLQIQISDGYDDWTKITRVELTSVGLETAYPNEYDRRLITTTLQFQVLCYMSPPVDIRDDYIKRIKLRISELASNVDMDLFKLEEIPGNADEYSTIADSAVFSKLKDTE